MENTQDYQDYQDYRAEILGIVRSNASPGIMRNKLEDYHENDLADVFPSCVYTSPMTITTVHSVHLPFV